MVPEWQEISVIAMVSKCSCVSNTPITPAQVTFFRVVISTLFLLVVLAIAVPSGIIIGISAVLQMTSSILGLVYFLELVFWFYAVRHIDVSRASSITTPWPALTMVLAVPFLGDRLEASQSIALCVVVVCIYGLTIANPGKTQDAEASVEEGF